MNHNSWRGPLAAALMLAGIDGAQAGFTGTFSSDNSLAFFKIVADGATANTIRSYGYAGSSTYPGGTMADGSTVVDAGGFDTLLTLYDGSGHRIGSELNDDGAGVPADPVTEESLDSLYEGTLGAGTYWLALGLSQNYGDDYLGDGFAWDDLTGFISASINLCGSPAPFMDFTCTERSGGWALDIVGFSSVEQKTWADVQAEFPLIPPPPPPPLPEPGTLALLGLGWVAMWRRRPR